MTKFISPLSLILASISCFSFCNSAQASIDWSNYLKPLEHNCNHDDIYISPLRGKKSVDKYLLKSVSKTKVYIEPLTKDFGSIEYTLKNATYRGYEINKIKFEDANYHVTVVEIFFKNPNAYKILSNFTFGNENRIEKVGTKNFWIVKRDGNLYSIPYKQKPKDSDWSKFVNLYNPKQMYSTDIDSGTYDSYQIDNDGELAIFNELKFNRKTNSLLCSNGAEYN